MSEDLKDMMECPTCEGSGACPFCQGEREPDCPYDCDDCTCSECNGDGEVMDPEAHLCGDGDIDQ